MKLVEVSLRGEINLFRIEVLSFERREGLSDIARSNPCTIISMFELSHASY
jgi:hypothetical protein